jgi:hypothetical protein
LNIVDENNETPLDWARNQNALSTAPILAEAMDVSLD